MKEVICINNKEIEGNIKIGERFIPVAEQGNKFIIQLGNGVKGDYLKSRFKEV
ncbi:hypothetical protein CLSAB_18870 [Clostridium saccharobutylicum]|uniref:hypothetical protein n=1 Tax=Clostridium saccharobutylicum TaxID=169679 RepID=UPI0009CEB8DF|nr:hypothetical protein [Clostridium saccharobutylicum]OOM17167.1 hypothetical protein CLSAB_18870 [Clostridium saccharobutylicum]